MTAGHKSGQVTLYLVIGLVITFVVIFGIYLANETEENERIIDTLKGIDVPQEMKPIKRFVDSCVESVASRGIRLLGLLNGLQPREAATVGAYSIYVANPSQITLASLEHDLERYLATNLPVCLDNFSQFPGQRITADAPQAQVNSNKKDMSIRVDFPVTLFQKGRTFSFQDSTISLPVRLQQLHKAMTTIATTYEQSGYHALYDYLGELDFRSELFAIEDTVYVVLTDTDVLLHGREYYYVFALQQRNETS